MISYTIAASKFRSEFSSVLSALISGRYDRVNITKNGKPVAVFTLPEQSDKPDVERILRSTYGRLKDTGAYFPYEDPKIAEQEKRANCDIR